MTARTDIRSLARQSQMALSRATVRDVNDHHLMQEVKYADVYHSETPSDFERWQMVGITSVPIKQTEDKKSSQQQSSSKTSEEGDWNHNQPTGPAAEALMLYLNGSRSHPVAIVDDRRVRPYDMIPGGSALYAADGSESMAYVDPNGAYLVSLDGASVDSKQSRNRIASLRHVTKPMQSHKIEKGQKQQGNYPHAGASVNTEVRCSKSRIEFFAGGSLVGGYDANSKTWFFIGTVKTGLDKENDSPLSSVVTEAGPALKHFSKPG